jgi:hypothetical protein
LNLLNRRNFLSLAAAASVVSHAQQASSPEATFSSILKDRGLDQMGEDFCWHYSFHVHRFVRGYQATGDPAWLDQGLRYYALAMDKLLTGPDGYKGWIGPYEYDHSVWCDVHVGDAIVLNGLVAFSEVVLADAKLRTKYGKPAEQYVEIARKHLFEKWDARGTWREDGPYGAYQSWNRYGDPGNPAGKPWTDRAEIRNSGLALPFNKQDDVAAVAMKLYRITGEQKFFDRAFRIFAYQKSRLELVKNADGEHYVWNYWEPYAASDLDVAGHKCRHWVGVHPERAYQQGEVANIVEAYHTGIVFDEMDIRRFLNTNLKVMWNGSIETPAWRNSNAGLPGVDSNKKSTAGVLWTALGDFDETIRKLSKRGSSSPVSFERRTLRGKPKVFDYPHTPCTGLILAAALPASFSAKEGTMLVCDALVKGVVEVAQYSEDGTRKIATLRQADQQWFLFHRWSGMEPGRYRVRWTYEGGGYREAPVVCERG